MKTVRIGSGAGFSGDRIEPAVELADARRLSTIWFSSASPSGRSRWRRQARAQDPSRGFDPMLERRLEAVLPACRAHGVTIVTNMGAANPAAAGARARELARRWAATV